MNKSLIQSLILLIVGSITAISCTPKLSRGQYKGVEAISVSPDHRYWPGVFKLWQDTDSSNRQWFHEIVISVKRSSATIIKNPFYLKDQVKIYSESEGGFYYYTGDIDYDPDGKTFTIFSRLDSCRFCPRSATATPLYTYESYYIRKYKGGWIVNTNYEENLIFERQ